MTRAVPAPVFFALFTVSGFAGLIYESIWSHYLKLFLGHAAYAQTLVLAIFMGGMAIGSWLVSRFTQRIANLLLGYAAAELGIGILAIAFHGVFRAATGWAFDSVLPALGGTGVDLFKWTLASLLILPASVLLGTTFPLMSAGIIRLYPESSGRALSMLYFTNSFGAAAGVLVSGFVLIERFGLPGTILTAGLMNVALALVVWALARRMPQAPAAQTAAAAAQPADRAFGAAMLTLACATGAASFIYEITWIRMLTMALGASTHAFEVMLSAFILGMSLGAFWIRHRIVRYAESIGWIAGVLVVKALCAVYAVWVFDNILGYMEWVMNATARTDAGYFLMTFYGLVASVLVMLPTAFCAGMTLPLVTQALTSRGHGEGSIGRVYGANTAGCILGAAFATHVGMQWLGIKGLTGLGAVLDVAVAALVLVLARRPGAAPLWRGKPFVAAAAAVIAGLAVFFATDMNLLRMSSGIYRSGVFLEPASSKLEFYRDGKTATIAVIGSQTRKSIRTNGKPDASIQLDMTKPASSDEPTQSLVGTLPLAMRPQARSAAIIGFGSGLTTHAILGSAALTEVDTIEIEPMMVEGAKLFMPANRRAYQDARSHVFIEDAKTFFAAHGKRYDIIVSEPSNPWVSGVSTLFSQEFYGQVKRHLAPDGLLVQWIQAYEINIGLVSSIFQALGAHFPDYAVYCSGGDLIVIATPAARLPPLTPAVFQFPDAAAELGRLGFHELRDLQALRVGGRRVLEPLFLRLGFPPNSDFFPILDQHSPRARFKNENADALRRIRELLPPVMALLDEEATTPLARTRVQEMNRPLRVLQASAGAEAIGIFLGTPAGQATVLPLDERNAPLMARALLDDCRGAEDAWIEALAEVAKLTTPYLERGDVLVIFERASKSRCWRSLDEAKRERVRLLRAVSERDAAAMAALAMGLLERKSATSDAERALHVYAALAGNLAGGRNAEARAIAERYLGTLPVAERESLLLRLLLSHLDAALRPAPR